MSSCPGPFHGAIPLPLPVPCDAVHVILGLLCGCLPHPAHRIGAAVFVLYQMIEEGMAHDVDAFVRDCGLFLLGFVLSQSLWHR